MRGADSDQTLFSGLKRRKGNRQRIASVAARNRKDVPALQASQTRAGAQRSGSDESAGEETFRVWNYVLVNVVRVVVGRIEADLRRVNPPRDRDAASGYCIKIRQYRHKQDVEHPRH